MAIISQVWNGKAFVNTDSDTVDQKNVNDGAASSSTLWTSSKVSEELTKKAEKTHTHPASQVSGLHAVATNGNYESLINKPTIPPAYTHPNDSNTRHVTDAEKATWNGKANANHTHDYAPTNHSHSNYAPTSHTHTIANISGLQGEIDNLKQSVSNGKNLIASAITEKGIAASGSETHQSLANKIKQISTGGMETYKHFVGNLIKDSSFDEGGTPENGSLTANYMVGPHNDYCAGVHFINRRTGDGQYNRIHSSTTSSNTWNYFAVGLSGDRIALYCRYYEDYNYHIVSCATNSVVRTKTYTNYISPDDQGGFNYASCYRNDKIYAIGNSGNLYKVNDIYDISLGWTNLGYYLSGYTLSCSNNKLFVICSNRRIICINTSNDAVLWDKTFTTNLRVDEIAGNYIPLDSTQYVDANTGNIVSTGAPSFKITGYHVNGDTYFNSGNNYILYKKGTNTVLANIVNFNVTSVDRELFGYCYKDTSDGYYDNLSLVAGHHIKK